MVFGSAIFLYAFLPLFLAVYYLSPKKLRTLVVALASYVFYGWWRPDFVSLMLISTVVDFVSGRRITAARAGGGRGKAWVTLSVVVNLGLLAYFKYANFGVESLNTMLAGAGYEDVKWTSVILPVGISFYTFQTLSYTIDVYRGTAKPVRSFMDFMCYVAMFPQLVAGPIVRYNTIAEQLHSRTHTVGKFYRGVLAFQAGFVKKLLVADILGQVADEAFAAESLGTLSSWIGTAAYTFQIYFDFSGYSDMAIGLGLMIGFSFPVNFCSPYHSRSITDFWRRWHISLSSFLRDYLYLPLGGNRKGKLRTYVNLSATMLIGGLWHGAAWTFIAWGAYQGLWLVMERLAGRRSLLGWLPKALHVPATMVIVMVGWVLFRAEDLPAAGHLIGSMFGWIPEGVESAELYLRPIHYLAGAAAIAVTWLAPRTQDLIKSLPHWWTLGLQPLFLLALVQLHFVSHVPFLYFQF
ncbi:MAG: alginate O-acetyltransferase complex protein AlgI [Candidatus Paceibacteria bacterium]